MQSNYRILNRFSELVRIALRGFKFTEYQEGGYVCGTGRCPLAVAIELSGGHAGQTPGPYSVAREMVILGLVTENDFDKVKIEANDFIENYSARNFTWKKYLGV